MSSAQHQGINCTIPEDFRQMPVDRKADFMVDVIGPWYAGFYAPGWTMPSTNPSVSAC
jgi:hypothetical protein